METFGKIISKPDMRMGETENGSWQEQTIVVETMDDTQRKQALVFRGDKATEASKLQVGEVVKVRFSPSSREYNGRWYTQLDAFWIERYGRATSDGDK